MSLLGKGQRPLMVFSLDSGSHFARTVATHLGVTPAAHEERRFADGEYRLRPMSTVAGADVYIVQSVFSDADRQQGGEEVDALLLRLLFFIHSLKDAGADRVTLVAPFLAYGRKDRRTKAHDALPLRYLAAHLELAGLDCAVTLEAHNQAAFENVFRCRTVHLPAHALFAAHWISRQGNTTQPLVVGSPDIGGIKRAEALRALLSAKLGVPLGKVFIEKYRDDETLHGGAVIGDVSGAQVILVDDLIAGGGTMTRAVRQLRDAGAARVHLMASHGQFCGDALSKVAALPVDSVVVTNSLPQADAHSLMVLDCAPLVAQLIRALYRHEDLTPLMR